MRLSSLGYFTANASRNHSSPFPKLRWESCCAFTTAKCALSRSERLTGNVVTPSLPPFPSRTTVSLRVRSTSFTWSRRHYSKHIPVPYSSRMIKFNKQLSTCFKGARNSSLVNTVGKRAGFFARVTSDASLRTTRANPPPTVHDTKTPAPKTPGSGWFWLEAVTFRSSASEVKNASVSALPILAG